MALCVDVEKRLDDFCLRVRFETGEGPLALLGPSGSGKSLTLRCIAGLLRPDRGRITHNGRVLFDSETGVDLPPQKRRVGLVFQSYALVPHLSLLENVALGYHARPRRARRGLALEQLRRFRLETLADSLPAALSGGERQRAALARTLAAAPEALLLDEPFSALDTALRWDLELALARTLEGYGGDVVLVTHSLEEVCHLASSVCVLTQGRSEAVQSVQALLTAPRTLAAARIAGWENFSAVTRLPEGGLCCTDWGLRLPELPAMRGAAYAGVRAGALRPGPGPVSLPCVVERVVNDGSADCCLLHTPGPGLLRLELPKGTSPAPGAALTVHAAPEDVLLFPGGEAP